MVDVLIVDLDGVLRVWDAEEIRQVEERHTLPLGSILAAAFEPVLLAAAVTGQLTDEQWRAKVATSLRSHEGVNATQVVSEWSESCGRVDDMVLSLLRGQRQERLVVLLTNATTRLHADLSALGIAAEFDRVFSSAEVGVAKPDAGAFLAVCTSLAVKPTSCAFVDDSPANVQSAVAVGMQGHTYRGPQELEIFLRSLPTSRR